MSPDVIGTIIATFGAAATMLAGVFGMIVWLGRKTDARFDKVDNRLNRLADDVSDLKVAVARLEGPRPGLQFAGPR